MPDSSTEPCPADAAVDSEALEVLGEQYSAAILAATGEPRSARELSDLLDVPIATCYRRIEALVEAGLLVEAGRALSDRGRRTSVYRRAVEEIRVSFNDGVAVALAERDDDGAAER